MEFFLYLNGVKRGPFAEARVQAFLADGLLLPSDLAADEADAEWKTLGSFACLALPATPSPPPPAAPPPRPAMPAMEQPAIPAEVLGPYARATLAPNETPYFKTSLHWIIFVRFAFLALVALVFLALPFAIAVQALTASEIGWFVLPLPVFLLVPPALAFASSELLITDRRVLIKSGIIRRQTLEMFISKVESIAIDQSFLGRLLDYGSVVIRGTGGLEEPFAAIAHPIEFRNCVQRLQHNDRNLTAR